MPSDLEPLVERSLGWYGRWMGLPKVPTDVIVCWTIASMSKGLVFCDDADVQMGLDLDGPPKLQYIAPAAPNSKAEAFRNFGERAAEDEKPLGRSMLHIRRGRLDLCEVDGQSTVRLALVARDNIARAVAGSSIKTTVLYPWVCKGDPLYHVYVLRHSRLSYIWQFGRTGESLELNWSYEPGNRLRPVPPVADSNMKNSSLWYKKEQME